MAARKWQAEYASITQLSAFEKGFALPSVPWSKYPLITHAMVCSLLPELARFNPSIALLNEEDKEIRSRLSNWFPNYFSLDAPQGAGSLIWMKLGVPMHCIAGPNLTKTEVLAVSQELWSA